MELFYGNGSIANPIGFSRFIFNLDLTLLKEKYSDGSIPPVGCDPNMKHTLKMVNTSFFDKELLNTSTSTGRLRATSFDLILFRIPYKDLDPNQPQNWDEGVGYDFADLMNQVPNDKDFSDRPSNWFVTSGITTWEEPGIYNNNNTGINTSWNIYYRNSIIASNTSQDGTVVQNLPESLVNIELKMFSEKLKISLFR
jgi:hypothetical protein